MYTKHPAITWQNGAIIVPSRSKSGNESLNINALNNMRQRNGKSVISS